MTAAQRLSKVFDRGLENGLERLSAEEQELYLIQDFIIEIEMNGLTGYFYNRLSTPAQIIATANAMHRHGLLSLELLFREAMELFSDYVPPDPVTTWSETLRRYDPNDRLNSISKQIAVIENYGLSSSTI